MNPNLIPDNQKKSYLKSLSEDDFRDQVVRPLMIAKGMRRGAETCGTTEAGKDCYLYTADAMRSDILYAIQTKKGDVKLSASAADNVVNIITQLRTALRTSIADAKSKKKQLPDAVLLVASGTINKAAQEHIVHDVDDPRLSFRDADDLIPDIDKLMPEFWLGINTQRFPYLRAFREQLVNLSDSLDLTQLGVESHVASPVTDDTFVQLYLSRIITKVETQNGQKHELIDFEDFSVNQLLAKPIRLSLIIGDAGSGKTTALRRIAMLIIDHALRDGKTAKVPICLRALDIARSSDALVAIAEDATRRLNGDNTPAFSLDDLKKGEVILLVDGFDELGTEELRESFTKKLGEFHDKYNLCRLMMTSRESPHLQDIESALPFVRLRISPINVEQAGRIVDRITKGKNLPVNTTEEVLRRLDMVHGIDLSPLLVTVFVATTDYARSDIPANITELFKKFTEMMLGRWDSTKGLAHQYQANVKDFLLQRVAFVMHDEQRTTITVEELKKSIGEELGKRGLSGDAEVLFNEIVGRSGLMRQEGDELSFRHLLIQEFFAGRGIPSQAFLRSVLGKQWWMRAIIFYFGERPDDEHALLSLPAELAELKGTDLYQAAVSVGLALQACYLTTTGAKLEVLEWVVHSMATSFDEVLEWCGQGQPSAEALAVVFYYVYGRDALACKVIEEFADRSFATVTDESASHLSAYDERGLFWCLVGLIGTGNMKRVEELLKKFRPNDIRLLFPLVLGCAYLEKVQVAGKEEKKIARRVGDQLRPIVREMSKAVIRELKGILLEMRGGKMKAIDDHRTQAELEREYVDPIEGAGDVSTDEQPGESHLPAPSGK